MLCDYKSIFGNPNTGVHKYRLFDIAIIDTVLTCVLAYVIHSYNPQYAFLHILIVLFILGIALHRIFCVRTTIDKLLFKNARVWVFIKPLNKSNRSYNIKWRSQVVFCNLKNNLFLLRQLCDICFDVVVRWLHWIMCALIVHYSIL